eukprot:GHVH01005208.1.p1 GENE.GHVH01005208.1~~GHVH01005208.1.p1  ORF type:complete len:119 (+),score=14.58 GHVH01005208.1:122-478(+)
MSTFVKMLFMLTSLCLSNVHHEVTPGNLNLSISEADPRRLGNAAQMQQAERRANMQKRESQERQQQLRQQDQRNSERRSSSRGFGRSQKNNGVLRRGSQDGGFAANARMERLNEGRYF